MPLPAIFDQCCEPATKRYDLSRPFRHGDRIYATNGHIMVWCPAQDHPDFDHGDPNRKVPDPEPIISDARKHRNTVPLPEADGLEKCYVCDGTGLMRGSITCDVCDCTYEIRRHGQPLEFDCLVCEGRGGVKSWKPIEIDASGETIPMASYYAWLLRQHGVTEIGVQHPHDLIVFSGPGFEGALEPMACSPGTTGQSGEPC